MAERSTWSGRTAGAENEGKRRPAEIRADIEATRTELAGTVQEIKERLSASHLRSEGMEKLRDATVGRIRTGMTKGAGSLLKESPVARKVAYNALTAVFFGASFGRLIFGREKADGRRRTEEGGLMEGLRCGISNPTCPQG